MGIAVFIKKDNPLLSIKESQVSRALPSNHLHNKKEWIMHSQNCQLTLTLHFHVHNDIWPSSTKCHLCRKHNAIYMFSTDELVWSALFIISPHIIFPSLLISSPSLLPPSRRDHLRKNVLNHDYHKNILALKFPFSWLQLLTQYFSTYKTLSKNPSCSKWQLWTLTCSQSYKT